MNPTKQKLEKWIEIEEARYANAQRNIEGLIVQSSESQSKIYEYRAMLDALLDEKTEAGD